MWQKIMNISLKIIVGVFVFYVILGFILIPWGRTWGIRSQGAKILKHPVHVRSVQFNPFLLRLGVS